MIWVILGIVITGGTVGTLYVIRVNQRREEEIQSARIAKEYKLIREAVIISYKKRGQMPKKMDEVKGYLKEPIDFKRYLLQPDGEGLIVGHVSEYMANIIFEKYKLNGSKKGINLWLRFREFEENTFLFRPDIECIPSHNIKTTTKVILRRVVPHGMKVDSEEWENKKIFYEKPGKYTIRLRIRSEESQWSEWAEKEIEIEEDQGLQMITTGNEHFFILKKNGILYGGGGNGYGQLGNEKRAKKSNLVEISTLKNIRYISAGVDHSLCITYQNRVYSTGRNHHGQLGLGHIEDQLVWKEISGIDNVKNVVAGHGISGAVTNDGKLYLWGRNEFGQISDNGKMIIQKPLLIEDIEGVLSISIGIDHILGILFDKTIVSWGGNKYGQLGDGTRLTRNEPSILELEKIKSIACGDSTSFALNELGQMYVWGKNTNQELGIIGSKFVAFPTLVQKIRNGFSVNCATKNVVVLTDDFNVLAWGFKEDTNGISSGYELDEIESFPRCREAYGFVGGIIGRSLEDDIFLWDKRDVKKIFSGGNSKIEEQDEESIQGEIEV